MDVPEYAIEAEMQRYEHTPLELLAKLHND
jgi:hypothetical protein